MGRAIERGTTVIDNDYRGGGGALPAARQAGVRAAMATPIRIDGRTVGVIAIGRLAADQPFSGDDARVLEVLADVASAALVDPAATGP